VDSGRRIPAERRLPRVRGLRHACTTKSPHGHGVSNVVVRSRRRSRRTADGCDNAGPGASFNSHASGSGGRGLTGSSQWFAAPAYSGTDRFVIATIGQYVETLGAFPPGRSILRVSCSARREFVDSDFLTCQLPVLVQACRGHRAQVSTEMAAMTIPPIIFINGVTATIPMSVKANKAGAVDFRPTGPRP